MTKVPDRNKAPKAMSVLRHARLMALEKCVSKYIFARTHSRGEAVQRVGGGEGLLLIGDLPQDHFQMCRDFLRVADRIPEPEAGFDTKPGRSGPPLAEWGYLPTLNVAWSECITI